MANDNNTTNLKFHMQRHHNPTYQKALKKRNKNENVEETSTSSSVEVEVDVEHKKNDAITENGNEVNEQEKNDEETQKEPATVSDK